jgi:hypothetical protein
MEGALTVAVLSPLVALSTTDTALLAAAISGIVSVLVGLISRRTAIDVAKREAQEQRKAKEEERRSEAKVVLDEYRGPLLDAAWELGNRIGNIRHGKFLETFLGTERAETAKLTTMFRFAHYFGWRELVRRKVQLLRFENEDDTRLVAGFIGDVTAILASDRIDGRRGMLWADEQRAIGELMVVDPPDAPSYVRGHAAFHRDYEKLFAPWMERLAKDVVSLEAVKSVRLELLQWGLFWACAALGRRRRLWRGQLDADRSDREHSGSGQYQIGRPLRSCKATAGSPRSTVRRPRRGRGQVVTATRADPRRVCYRAA